MINVCPTEDLQMFYPSEADGYNVLNGQPKLIQINLNEPDTWTNFSWT